MSEDFHVRQGSVFRASSEFSSVDVECGAKNIVGLIGLLHSAPTTGSTSSLYLVLEFAHHDLAGKTTLETSEED